MRVDRKGELPISVSLDPKPIKHKRLGEDEWEITHKTHCSITTKHEEWNYRIKPGFKTDYRSGPRWLNKIIEQVGPPLLAISWVVHDVNYEGYLSSRKEADVLLYEMLLHADVKRGIAELIYIGLRIFGKSNYTDSKDNQWVKFDYKSKVLPEGFVEADYFLLTADVNNELRFTGDDYAFVKDNLKRMAEEEGLSIEDSEINHFYKDK